MARQIKFRAWDRGIEEMLPWKELVLPGYQDVLLIGLQTELYQDSADIELQQFTGILDKNGTEIYEGDIVKRFFEGEALLGTVIYYLGAFSCKFSKSITSGLTAKLEVVGNIYENPDLLKS